MSTQRLNKFSFRPKQSCLFYFAIFILGMMTACSQNGSKGEAAQASMNFVVPVTIGTVTQTTVPVEVRVIGNGEAYSTVVVKSRVDGQLDRAHFLEGQDVKQGDLLFTIDSRPFDSTLKQSE